MMALTGPNCAECMGCGACDIFYTFRSGEPVFSCDCCGEGIYENGVYLETPEGSRYCGICLDDMKKTV